MKIPQLFVRIGNNRFMPISHPVNNKPLYFWDELKQQIVPDDGKLRLKIIEGCPYFVLEGRRTHLESGHIN